MTPTKMILPAIFICILVCATYSTEDVIYPKMHANQQLATQLHCLVKEAQHFRYSSVSNLWGTAGGDILLNADIALHCLGDDTGGMYGSEALKYRAQISNLMIEQRTESENNSSRRRGGADDASKNPWEKVKGFFKGSSENQDKPTDKKEDAEKEFNSKEVQHLYSMPFLFVQLANGSIPEIRFAENEVNISEVKNFKRHLVDSFATNLNFNRKQEVVAESSAIGHHMSSYDITKNDKPTSLHLAEGRMLEAEEPILVVSKMITGNDILYLAPSKALNDLEKVDLKMQQKQVFQGGKLISSSGTSSLHIFQSPETEKNRGKREAEEDVSVYFQAHSSFDLQLYKKQSCSEKPHSQKENKESTIYFSASRFAETDDSAEVEKLKSLQETVGDINEAFQSLLNGEEAKFDEKMELMFEMVAKEINLNLDHESGSASNVVRNVLTKEKMTDMCTRKFSFCKDFVQLLALAGGSNAENVLLSFVSEKSSLTSNEIRFIIDVLSDVSRPSRELLDSLDKLLSGNKLNSDLMGSVSLTAGSVGFGFEEKEKTGISKTLVNLLRSKMDSCHSDSIILDVLEAIGNLGSEQTVSAVLEVSEKCRKEEAVEIACLHALRHSVHLSSVQKWMKNAVASGGCDLTDEVAGTLLEKIQDQEEKHDAINWPRYNFNEVDEILKKKLFASSCSPDSIVLYFRRKQNAEANDIAKKFQPETESKRHGSNTRQMRAPWSPFGCREWTYDYKYPQIQTNSEFASDRQTFNLRRSCLMTKRMGPAKANADIYAGMFAGLQSPSLPTNYKIFTKLVFEANFLSRHLEIGSFYFYIHSGSTKTYVRIMGKTHEKVTTSDVCSLVSKLFKYRYQQHIPIYKFNIYVVQVSLGIHLQIELSLSIGCPGTEVKVQPKVTLRAGGEAMGTVAFVRAGLNLGGNFNYKLQFIFTQKEKLCVKGNHGYDPMSVSIQTWFQFWKIWGWRWGHRWIWRPGFLSWNIGNGYIQPWFADTCM